MTLVLVGTGLGCRVFKDSKEHTTELSARMVGPMTAEPDGACLAAVNGTEIWRRSSSGTWTQIASTAAAIEGLVSAGGEIYAALSGTVLVRIDESGTVERISAFDDVAGREEWFGQGPPLCIRNLTAAADGSLLLASVHVGGIPRSTDKGKTWAPTIPVMHDVHEVRVHPQKSNVIAAATAVGLCVSVDGGLHWDVLSEGLQDPHYLLSVAMLENEVIFSHQEGPFAKQSQIWKWTIGEKKIEQVHDGLPEWLGGKVDTGQIAAGGGKAAIADCGGTLWISPADATEWHAVATDLSYTTGLLVF